MVFPENSTLRLEQVAPWRLPSRSWVGMSSGSGARGGSTTANDHPRQREKHFHFSLSPPTPAFCWPHCRKLVVKDALSMVVLVIGRRAMEGRKMVFRANRQMANQGTCTALQHPILGKYQAHSFCAISFVIQLTSYPFLIFPSDFDDLSPVPCITHRCWSLLCKEAEMRRGWAKGGDGW